MKVYNKLVRDRIPEIIEADGKKFDIHYAKEGELMTLLQQKLQEEIAEFNEDKNLEELSDILEVVFGLASVLGYSEEELLNKREEKRLERGGFMDGIVLEKVYED